MHRPGKWNDRARRRWRTWLGWLAWIMLIAAALLYGAYHPAPFDG